MSMSQKAHEKGHHVERDTLDEGSRLDSVSVVQRAWTFLSNRGKTGLLRARGSVLSALQMTVAGVGAYAFAERVLGHQGPIFAAVAAMIALGFSREPQLRRVLEIALGCTLGILIGDLTLYVLGTGFHVAFFVVFVSVLLARILDPGPMFAMQMGLQALLVVMLPAPEGGPLTRSADAVVGGIIALIITVLTPKDPRRKPARDLERIADELATSLHETAAGVRDGDSRQAWHALIRCRSLQPKIDEATHATRSARELSQYSPTHRRHRHEARRLSDTVEQLDLAVRSMRIVSRRTTSMLDHGAIDSEGAMGLSAALDEVAEATTMLSQAVADPGAQTSRMTSAQNALGAAAASFHPQKLGAVTFEAETVVLLMRSLVTDLLEATGLSHDDATLYLPDLHTDHR